jgi:BirA family biotin operon repressor/biotin-[acetyl-CoA-carboxylase] ligase
VARAWSRNGAPEGSVVIAEEQSAGKGRMGRTWRAASGRNLLFSIILRPELPSDRWGLITLAASVGVAETIETVVSPYIPAIKWPNDIFIDDAKCCGMLLETVPSSRKSGTEQGVILGVGLNVNQIEFPPPIEKTATSLRLISGQLVERAPLFVQLLPSIRRRYEQLTDDNGAAVREAFMNRMLSANKRVTLRYTNQESEISGIVDGIDETGGLRLLIDGTAETFHAGDVTSHTPPS